MFAVLPPFFALLFIVLLLLLFLALFACGIASWGVRVFSVYSGKISVASFFSTFHPFTAVQHPWSSRSAELETRRARDTCMLLGRLVGRSVGRNKPKRTTGRQKKVYTRACAHTLSHTHTQTGDARFWTGWSVPPSKREAHAVFKPTQVLVRTDN